MHSVYAFAMNIKNLELDANSIIDKFSTKYNDLTDENNWYQPLILVKKDGTLVSLCEAGDWRGRDELTAVYEEIPVGERYEHALRFAWTLIGTDLKLFGSNLYTFGHTVASELDTATIDEIKHEIYMVPGRIAVVLEARQGVPPTQRFDMDLWSASRDLILYNTICEAIYDGHAPWCDPCDPYKGIRAQHLGWDIEDWDSDDTAILLVDIHT